MNCILEEMQVRDLDRRIEREMFPRVHCSASDLRSTVLNNENSTNFMAHGKPPGLRREAGLVRGRLHFATGAVASLLIVSAFSSLSLTHVSASKPVEMTFFFSFAGIDGFVAKELPSGATKITVDSVRFDITGDWEGTWEHSTECIVTDVFFCKAFATFGGTIAEKDGTVRLRIQTHGKVSTFGDFTSIVTFLGSQITILRGTGDLSNIHGHGVEDPIDEVHIRVHFDP